MFRGRAIDRGRNLPGRDGTRRTGRPSTCSALNDGRASPHLDDGPGRPALPSPAELGAGKRIPHADPFHAPAPAQPAASDRDAPTWVVRELSHKAGKTDAVAF